MSKWLKLCVFIISTNAINDALSSVEKLCPNNGEDAETTDNINIDNKADANIFSLFILESIAKVRNSHK